jgi:CRISPR-associated protein Cas2
VGSAHPTTTHHPPIHETLVPNLLRYPLSQTLAQSFQTIKSLWRVDAIIDFRCRLSQKEREKLRWELEKILTAEDNLLLIGMCDRCQCRIPDYNREDVWIPTIDRFKVIG